MSAVAEQLDEYGMGAWIFATVLGFALFWPLGLATLIYLKCSGRMHAWRYEMRAWKEEARAWKQDYRAAKAEARARWGCGGGWRNSGNEPGRGRRTSGNAAFDEYRSETLRRLEQEQQEFEEYLDRLRAAKDKAEFDAFMAERRGITPAS